MKKIYFVLASVLLLGSITIFDKVLAVSGTPVFYAGISTTFPVSTITCGDTYSFDVPAYSGRTIWLKQYKGLVTTFNGPFYVPMAPYTSICNKDEGDYEVLVYEVATAGGQNTQGSYIGSATLKINPKPVFTPTPTPLNVSGPYFSFSHHNGTLTATKDAYTFSLINGLVGDSMYVNATLTSLDGYSSVSKGQLHICTITSGNSCSVTAIPPLSDVGTWHEDVLINGVNKGKITFTVAAPGPLNTYTPTPTPVTSGSPSPTVSLAPSSTSVSCTLAVSNTKVKVGEKLTWVLRSSPAGYKAYWYGTKNTLVDVSGTDSGFTTNYDWVADPYPAGSEGSYMRWMQLRDSSGKVVCGTSDFPVYVSVVSAGAAVSPTPVPSLTPAPTPGPISSAVIRGRVWYDQNGDGLADGFVKENFGTENAGCSGLTLAGGYSGAANMIEISKPGQTIGAPVRYCNSGGPHYEQTVDQNNWSVYVTLAPAGWRVITSNPVAVSSSQLADGAEDVWFGLQRISATSSPSPTLTPTLTITPTPIPFNPSSGGYFTFSHNNGTLTATRDAWTFQILNGMVGDRMYVNASLTSPDGYSAVSKGTFDICTITSGNSCSATRVPLISDVGTWHEDVYINGVNKGKIIVTVVAPTGPGSISTLVPSPVNQNRLYSLSEINDGDIIRGEGDIAVWIVKVVGEKRFKRWLFGPQIFQAYSHLGFDKVKNVSKATLSNFDTAVLIRKEGDAKVYELTDFVPGVRATRRWVPTAETFLQRGFDFDSVYTVNLQEFNFYTEGAPLPVSLDNSRSRKNLLSANISQAMARFFGWEK